VGCNRLGTDEDEQAVQEAQEVARLRCEAPDCSSSEVEREYKQGGEPAVRALQARKEAERFGEMTDRQRETARREQMQREDETRAREVEQMRELQRKSQEDRDRETRDMLDRQQREREDRERQQAEEMRRAAERSRQAEEQARHERERAEEEARQRLKERTDFLTKLDPKPDPRITRKLTEDFETQMREAKEAEERLRREAEAEAHRRLKELEEAKHQAERAAHEDLVKLNERHDTDQKREHDELGALKAKHTEERTMERPKEPLLLDPPAWWRPEDNVIVEWLPPAMREYVVQFVNDIGTRELENALTNDGVIDLRAFGEVRSVIIEKLAELSGTRPVNLTEGEDLDWKDLDRGWEDRKELLERLEDAMKLEIDAVKDHPGVKDIADRISDEPPDLIIDRVPLVYHDPLGPHGSDGLTTSIRADFGSPVQAPDRTTVDTTTSVLIGAALTLRLFSWAHSRGGFRWR